MKKLTLLVGAFMLCFSLHAKSVDTVTLETSLGNISIKLFPSVAPKACENFITLAKKGYYNGTIFHRVIKDFMIQGGDPTGTGMGGQSKWGKSFEDEFKPNVVFNKAGLLAMANRGRNTNGSQFFITVKPTPWLNGRHSIFGEVIKGFDTLKKIENAKTGQRDKPIKDIRILKINFK